MGTKKNRSQTPLADGEIRFYDNYVPTLGVGDYLINFNQHLQPQGSTINETFTVEPQSFSVQGPRYSLAPEDILSFGPANNSQGLFDQYLPQVVLTNPDLPWVRNIFNDSNNQTPWLALISFVAGETIDDQLALQIPQVDNWQENRLMNATIPAYALYHHSDSDILWPDIKPEWYETDDDLQTTQTQIIDLSPTAFTRFVPHTNDLPYLAHARQIDPSAKDNHYLKINGDGWYSVLVGKRLPDLPPPDNDLPGRLNIVHLVSLEGFEDYLNGSTTLPTDKTRIRMISLASWSFTCQKEPADTFSGLMNTLLVDDAGQPKSTRFNLVTPNAEGYTNSTLNKGYVPMQYQTQQGEKTFAWYRGPFTPLPIESFTSGEMGQQFNTGSAAAIYDKTHGLFDLSYNTAFETGRFAALSDKYFGQQLMRWQQTGHNLMNQMLHRQFQLRALSGSQPSGEAVIDSLGTGGVTNTFRDKLQHHFKSTLSVNAQITINQSGGWLHRLCAKFCHCFGKRKSVAPIRASYCTLQAPVASVSNFNQLLTDPVLKNHVLENAGSHADSISEWLARLYLLENVPFNNLIPNADLLSQESVKFFYLDSNWINCLIQGALSIGIQSSRDTYYHTLTQPHLKQQVLTAANNVRTNLVRQYTYQKPALTEEPIDETATSGMLLRSMAVKSWPGLEVRAFAKTLPDTTSPDTSTEITRLRMDRLASDLLLCLWADVPSVVTISQPQEGIQFGFADAPDTENNDSYYLYLRSLSDADYGMPLSGEQYQINLTANNLIDSDRQLIISGENGLLKTLETTLNKPDIAVRDFVTEIIKVPEQAVFAAPESA